VTATFITGGGLFPMKGIVVEPRPLVGTVTIHEQSTIIDPFERPEWQMLFTHDRVVVTTKNGDIVNDRSNPRASFGGHILNTCWDQLHRAYFSGYARWTYLICPFFMGMPGFEVTEIAPWKEKDNETWRGLRVRFPEEIASHSKEQDFYFGDDFLLRRHDYYLEICGGVAVAQYVSDFVEVSGIRYPTKRRAYVRAPNLRPIRDLLLISIDLSNFQLST